MRIAAVISLLALLGAAPAPQGVTVAPSSTGFKQARDACPKALGAVTFVLGHVRIAEQPGVTSDIDDENVNAQTVLLRAPDGTQASIVIDAQKHTVSGKNVKLSGTTIACIGPQ